MKYFLTPALLYGGASLLAAVDDGRMPEQLTMPSGTSSRIVADPPPVAGSFFAAPSIGTLGIGLEAGYALNARFSLRVRSNWIGYNFDELRHGIAFKAKARNRSASLLLDYHPWGGGFRLTAGVLLSDLNARVDGSTYDESFLLGDNVYVADGTVCVRGKYSWNTLQPYAGLGWVSGTPGARGWYWSADIGVALLGNGRFTTSTSGNVTDGNGHVIEGGQIHESIRQEAHDVLKRCDHLHVYPVLQVGVGYRF